MFKIIKEQQTPEAEKVMIEYVHTYAKDHTLLVNMLHFFLKYVESRKDAAGLAANQLSYNDKRFNVHAFVIRMKSGCRLFINPKITVRKGFLVYKLENCLTWPGKKIKAKRYTCIDVEFYDIDGTKCNWTLKGYYAQVFQHELGHLNGVEEIFV